MQTKLLINGKLVAGDGKVEEVLNPATGKVLAKVAEASREQVDAAVKAAAAAFAGCRRAHSLCQGSGDASAGLQGLANASRHTVVATRGQARVARTAASRQERRMIVKTLLALLIGIGLVFTVLILRVAAARGQLRPDLESIGLGAVTNFFDTLGIGSFATTTAYIKLRRLVPDSFIPATLNVGHALPTVAQALIFIKLVQVDPLLLAACIVSAVAGSLVGAPIVQRTPVRVVQGFVGVALLIAAALYAAANLDVDAGRRRRTRALGRLVRLRDRRALRARRADDVRHRSLCAVARRR